jgi:hypothetical protein
MNNVHVVHGNPGLSAQLCVALANKCGAFDSPITYEEIGAGEKLIVKASAKLKNGPVVSESVSLEQAHTAGWTRMKDGGVKPFWKAKPAYMLQKRAATFLIRTYAPDVLLGFRTEEEWDDVGDGVQVRAAPAPQNLTDVLATLPTPAPKAPKKVEVKPEPEVTPEPTKETTEKEATNEEENTLNF